MKGTKLHLWTLATPALAAAGLLFASGGQAQQQMGAMASNMTAAPPVMFGPETPTFTRDILPIVQKSCQSCHRPGSIAPFSLLSYDDAKRWAPLIKLRTAQNLMPPWPIDRTVGIQQFKDDTSLTDGEIAMIGRWVDAGAPQGDLKDAPPPVVFPDYTDAWVYEERFGRPPDVIISNPPYLVKANGLDQWPEMESQILTGLDKPGYIMAIEAKPANPGTRYTFHHGGPSLAFDGESYGLMNSPAGKVGEIFPSDAGIPIKPGATVRYSMHFFPTGEDVQAVVRWGIWLHPEGQAPKFETPGEIQFRTETSTGAGGFPGHSKQISRRADLLIPPNGYATFRGVYVLDKPARLHSIRGHMHTRGKHQVVEVVYPDGRWELINKLDWDHQWANAFHYQDDAMPLLPKGTVMITTSVFDNTVNNRNNPDPDQWVVAGSRTVDEMAHIWLGITYFDNEEDFNAIVADREQRKQRATDAAAAAASK